MPSPKYLSALTGPCSLLSPLLRHKKYSTLETWTQMPPRCRTPIEATQWSGRWLQGCCTWLAGKDKSCLHFESAAFERAHSKLFCIFVCSLGKRSKTFFSNKSKARELTCHIQYRCRLRPLSGGIPRDSHETPKGIHEGAHIGDPWASHGTLRERSHAVQNFQALTGDTPQVVFET